MTDPQARRAAMTLAAQLPADPKAREQVVGYIVELERFLDGSEIEKPQTLRRTA